MHVPFRTSENARIRAISLHNPWPWLRPGARTLLGTACCPQLPPCSIASASQLFRRRQSVLGFLLQRESAFDGSLLARARAVRAIAVRLLEPGLRSRGADAAITTRLSVRERSPGPSTDICCWELRALASRRPGPSHRKLLSLGSTWARSKRSCS